MRHQRIVVKVGSSSLTTSDGGLCAGRVAYISNELASLARGGAQVLLVSSGAIAAGFPALGYPARPSAAHQRQAAAAVGQALLMQAWIAELARLELTAAQILLTGAELSQPNRTSAVGRAVEELLRRGVVPIFNENDSVPVGDVQVGDNDRLSALMAELVGADQLLILTDTDGLYTADPRHDPRARRIPRVEVIDDALIRMAGGSGSSVGTGGMRSKLEAARHASRSGVNVFIGRADRTGDMAAAASGHGRGTDFPLPQRSGPRQARDRRTSSTTLRALATTTRQVQP